MKLDLDRIRKKEIFFLFSLEKPYFIRAGNKGVNLKKECSPCSEQDCYACWTYQIFDDRNRLKLNRQQKEAGLSHNILWDIKKGKPKPDIWHEIKTSQDVEVFLRKFR